MTAVLSVSKSPEVDNELVVKVYNREQGDKK